MLPATLCLPTYLYNYWEYVFVFEFVWKSLCEILSSHNENSSSVEPPYYTGLGGMENCKWGIQFCKVSHVGT